MDLNLLPDKNVEKTPSSNIKWAWQRKFQNGDIILNTGLMLGYRKTGQKDEDGHDVYEIVEEEAEIVRRIYPVIASA